MKKLLALSAAFLMATLSTQLGAAESQAATNGGAKTPVPAATGANGASTASYDAGGAVVSRAAIAAGVAVVAAIAAIALIDNGNNSHGHSH